MLWWRVRKGKLLILSLVMKMESIWTKESRLPAYPTLAGDISADVLVIGGGIAGILCAYELQEAGVDCVLAEARRLCSGITKNTTAKISAQHGLPYHKILERFGLEKSKQYLRANLMAVERFRQLSEGIDCGFEEKDSYVYVREDLSRIEKELRALKTLGYEAKYVKELPLPFPVAGAVKFPNQAQFQPLNFLSKLSEKLRIYENTEVKELRGQAAVTEQGKIKAKKMIVATHFPFLNKHGSYFLKLYQQRSYVLGLENAADVKGMYLEGEKNGLSFRNYGDLLLLGGGGHRTGKQGGNWRELENLARRYYPQANIAHRWATQDCMSLDGVPYIGPYSGSTENLYVATGYNKWGMTGAMVSAMILRDMVLGKESAYAAVFSPSRSILRPQLVLNGAEAVKSWLSFTEKRCPHLGCALKWNPQEHSWDCPCHGSRFTKEGKLIDNPATGNLK